MEKLDKNGMTEDRIDKVSNIRLRPCSVRWLNEYLTLMSEKKNKEGFTEQQEQDLKFIMTSFLEENKVFIDEYMYVNFDIHYSEMEELNKDVSDDRLQSY